MRIDPKELQFEFFRSSGPGGQNVNKVSTAIHLRFDINASSLPDICKEKLRRLTDSRISGDGVVIIKAQRYRSQDKNREDALARLAELLRQTLSSRKKRIPTKPTRSAIKKRIERKTQRGQLKSLRRGVVLKQD